MALATMLVLAPHACHNISGGRSEEMWCGCLDDHPVNACSICHVSCMTTAYVIYNVSCMTTASPHAGVFKNTECIRQQCVQVDCFIRSARITAQHWRIAIFADSVLVMTAQQLLNMLNLGVAALQQIDLLVLMLTQLSPETQHFKR